MLWEWWLHDFYIFRIKTQNVARNLGSREGGGLLAIRKNCLQTSTEIVKSPRLQSAIWAVPGVAQ